MTPQHGVAHYMAGCDCPDCLAEQQIREQRIVDGIRSRQQGFTSARMSSPNAQMYLGCVERRNATTRNSEPFTTVAAFRDDRGETRSDGLSNPIQRKLSRRSSFTNLYHAWCLHRQAARLRLSTARASYYQVLWRQACVNMALAERRLTELMDRHSEDAEKSTGGPTGVHGGPESHGRQNSLGCR